MRQEVGKNLEVSRFDMQVLLPLLDRHFDQDRGISANSFPMK
jgi:hypothetical protein